MLSIFSEKPVQRAIRTGSFASPVETAKKFFRLGVQRIANTKKGRDNGGASGFDLLPVSSRKPERNHVFLAVPPLLSKGSDPLSQTPQKMQLDLPL
jgi:hypothetical protein